MNFPVKFHNLNWSDSLPCWLPLYLNESPQDLMGWQWFDMIRPVQCLVIVQPCSWPCCRIGPQLIKTNTSITWDSSRCYLLCLRNIKNSSPEQKSDDTFPLLITCTSHLLFRIILSLYHHITSDLFGQAPWLLGGVVCCGFFSPLQNPRENY